jgi:hypothetical protein
MVTGGTVVTGPGGARGAWKGSLGGPKGPQEGSRKGSVPAKSCESKGRCGLCLRKRKKRRQKNQSKGVLEGPWRPRGLPGAKKGDYLVLGWPREARSPEQCLIGVLKKGRKKEK